MKHGLISKGLNRGFPVSGFSGLFVSLLKVDFKGRGADHSHLRVPSSQAAGMHCRPTNSAPTAAPQSQLLQCNSAKVLWDPHLFCDPNHVGFPDVVNAQAVDLFEFTKISNQKANMRHEHRKTFLVVQSKSPCETHARQSY